MIPDIDAELNVNGRSGGKFEDENFVKYDKDTEKVLMELEVKRLINKVGHQSDIFVDLNTAGRNRPWNFKNF